jgi:hypothetical protein
MLFSFDLNLYMEVKKKNAALKIIQGCKYVYDPQSREAMLITYAGLTHKDLQRAL